MNNTRFATAIHILTLLASEPEKWLSSEFIAGSINLNPVVVRKELAVLNEVGIVVSKKGKEGGVQLSRPCHGILLSEIYLAVKNTEVLGKKNLKPNPKCPIGMKMNGNLEALFSETDLLVIDSLKRKTLGDFASQFV